jgi:RNA polymerase primary sigma factor
VDEPLTNSQREERKMKSRDGQQAESSYFRHLDNVAVLTQEREVELAKIIARAEKDLLGDIVRSPIAIEELALAAAELQNAAVPLNDFARPRDGEHHEDKRAREELIRVTSRATQLTKTTEPGRAGARVRRLGRANLTATLATYQLSPKLIDRILGRLDAGGDVERSRGRGRSRDTAALIRRARRELLAARGELIRSNMRLVVWMARRYLNQGLPLLDLVQEGNIGLMRAADKFDHRRGVRFSTYAGWWIRQSLNRALSDQSRVIRVPIYMLDLKHTLARTRQEFAQAHGREPTREEAAQETGMSLAQLDELMRSARQPVSMDAPLGPDNDTKLSDIVPDEATVSPVENISHHRMRARIRRILSHLTPREREMIELRFGNDQKDGITLQEIGHQFSLSRERVRQIEQEALGKLRKQAEAEDLGSYFSG